MKGAAKDAVSVASLLASYPIRLLPKQPSRKKYYDVWFYQRLSWFDRIILPWCIQYRQRSLKRYLNMLVSPEVEVDAETGAVLRKRKFFPEVIGKGVKFAIPVVFDNLSKWNGDVGSAPLLENLLTPDLLNAFSHSHKEIQSKGYSLSLKWRFLTMQRFGEIGSHFKINPEYIWLTIGSKQNVTSTILPGPVIGFTVKFFNIGRWGHSFGLLRRVNALSPGPPDRRVYRDIVAEYVYQGKDLERGERSYQAIPTRAECRDWLQTKGQRVAIDSVVLGGAFLEYKLIRNSDSRVVASGEADLEGMGIRMETEYLRPNIQYEGVWKVADIDNFLIDAVISDKV